MGGDLEQVSACPSGDSTSVRLSLDSQEQVPAPAPAPALKAGYVSPPWGRLSDICMQDSAAVASLRRNRASSCSLFGYIGGSGAIGGQGRSCLLPAGDLPAPSSPPAQT
ncbi:unnamed protein product [Gadus morhua 'NCC']